MAASCSSQISLLLGANGRSSDCQSSYGGRAMSLNLKSQQGASGGVCTSSRNSGAVSVEKGSGLKKRSLHVMAARRPTKDRDGALTKNVEVETAIPEYSEEDDMYMGKKLEGLEPDFWEGEQWDLLGFVVQYLWAFGVLVSLVACGVAVASYNSGASDIRDTDVFKEALENQENADSSDSESFQDFPETSEAPSL